MNKFKEQFLPNDYHVNLFQKLQNVKQKESSVKGYIE